ncbi:MAG TPA: hypothetical protein VKO45_00925 [Methanomicrobiales archaeon]|nr:hypothetical protein [Methanomicrobiales archaeon]
MYSILKPCKTTAAFEAIPRGHFQLDLALCEKILGKSCTVVANAGVLLIVRDRCEVTIHRDGRLLLKTGSEEVARDQAERIAGWLEGTPAVERRAPGRGSVHRPM